MHYKDALREHESRKDDVKKEMEEEAGLHEETKGIFAGGAGKLYRPGIFGKRRSVTTVPRKKYGKPIMYPTGGRAFATETHVGFTVSETISVVHREIIY